MISIENLLQGEANGLVKRTTPIDVDGYKFVPWKVTDDSKYESKTHGQWLLDNVPRSLVTVHGLNGSGLDGEFIRAIYGLKKFGSVDEIHMGSNIRISKLIESGCPIKISVHQKHNGEAATITGFVGLDQIFYYVIMSKSVPAVVKSREELEQLDPFRFKTCKEIGTQLFDLIDKLDVESKSALQLILEEWIFPIEKIDRVFKHIACEEPGLYILGMRNVHTLKLVSEPSFLSRMESFGFKTAKAYTDQEIKTKVTQVWESLELLPNTPDKPTAQMFENYLEPKNFLKVWSYVSLVYEQIACKDIGALDILAIGSGSGSKKFSLIEGTIISVSDPVSGELYMIKDKDLLYYLLRSVRTIIEHRKNIVELSSKSMKHWVQYLTPVWASAWDEFCQIILAYTRTYDFVKDLESNQSKSSNGGIDAPDFFAGVESWYSSNPVIVNSPSHNPIVIITTELEVELVEGFASDTAFVFGSKLPKDLNIPNGCVGVGYGIKLSSLVPSLYPNITFVRFTELTDELACLELGGKKLVSFWKDLVNENSTLDFCPHIEDLELVISRLKSIPGSSSTKSSPPTPTVYKVDYFDPAQLTNSDLDYWVKTIEVAMAITPGGKFDPSPTREQKALAKLRPIYPIPRSSQTVDLIVGNVIDRYQSLPKPARLAVFMTGIPGLGKDYCAEQAAVNLEQRIPELLGHIYVINQDMYQCDANKYLEGLKSCVASASIIFITRNGPGSSRSVDICKDGGFAIHLITPRDPQIALLGSCVCSALERKASDKKKSHVLSELPDDKIVSIVSNFFGALGSANSSIVGSNGHKYLGIEITGSPTNSASPTACAGSPFKQSLNRHTHLTIQHGLITRQDLIGHNVTIRLQKNVLVEAPGYKLEFNMVQITDQEISELVDSRCPHITMDKSGSAKPVQSNMWGWVVNNFFPESLGQVCFGSWVITISPLEGTLTGCVKIFD